MPPFEEREAARFSGYTWREWEPLPQQDKALAVAHYRLRHYIDSHTHDALELKRREREMLARMKPNRA